MGKAAAKVAAFALIILASCILINWVVIPNNPDGYQAETVDKLRLLAETPSPKMILAGGSNLAFSVDSGLLEEEFGIPVVNMGLAKSVGLSYMLEECKPYIRKGDLVVIAPEYELFYDLFYGSDGLIVELQYYPAGIFNLKSLGEWSTVVSKFAPIMQAKFSGFVRKGTASLQDSVYRRSGFDERGDLISHLDAEPGYQTHDLFPENAPFQEASIRVLNDFNRLARSRGARVVFTWPPLVSIEFDRYRERLIALDRKLRSDLTIPVISNPEDYVFSVDDMYDTAYHLMRSARRVRTLKLIDDLESAGGISPAKSDGPT